MTKRISKLQITFCSVVRITGSLHVCINADNNEFLNFLYIFNTVFFNGPSFLQLLEYS